MKNLSASHYLVLFLLIFTFSANLAAEQRVATVDFMKIINSSNDAKNAKNELEKISNESKKLIDSKRKALEPLEAKVKSGDVKPGTKEGQEIRQKTKELVELIQNKDEELKQKYSSLNQNLAEKTILAISNYAKKESIDIVLDKGQMNRSAVLFAQPDFDITESIIKLINSK